MALVLLACLSAASVLRTATEAARAGTGAGDFRNKTVEITELLVPEAPRVGQDVTLTCRFRLGGPDHHLYTVNWWRGKDHIYTYMADTRGPKHAYSFDGIQVKKDASSAESVVLEGVSEATSGVFKCEVMGEGPSFRTAVLTKSMEVVVPPRLVEIQARGLSQPPKYRIGESVMVNCTARGAKPRARLQWHLNGIQVRESNVYSWGDLRDQSGHYTTTLSLRWTAPDHFDHSGEARVTCVATVASFSSNVTKMLYLDQSSSSAPYNHRYYSAGSRSQVTGFFIHSLTLMVGRLIY